jgi:CBS domain-containing protein
MYKTAHPQTVEVKTTRIHRIATPRSNTNDRRGYLALMNLILALFNLIPAFPLDGGRVLRAYLWHRSGNSLSATRTAAKSGGILGYVLIGLGVLALFRGALVAGLWQIMIGGFILMAARSSYQSHLARAAFDHKAVRDLMERDPITIGPEITLADYVNRTVLAQGVTFVPVVEDGVPLGHMDRNSCRALTVNIGAARRLATSLSALMARIRQVPMCPFRI